MCRKLWYEKGKWLSLLVREALWKGQSSGWVCKGSKEFLGGTLSLDWRSRLGA